MNQLKDKVALITGASRGIGRSIAETFAREGAHILVNYHRDKDAADAVVAAIAEAGSDAVTIQADMTDPAGVRSLFAQGEAAYGRLDIVILNAHAGLGHGTVTRLGEDVIDGQLAVLKSYILSLQEAGRRIADGGVIICISSSATRVAVPQVALYGAVKLAIEHLARGVSRELADRGVRVVSLAPGLTRTDRSAGVNTNGVQACEPQEIADAALFLASDAARWVNTTTLYVNGGAVYAQ